MTYKSQYTVFNRSAPSTYDNSQIWPQNFFEQSAPQLCNKNLEVSI